MTPFAYDYGIHSIVSFRLLSSFFVTHLNGDDCSQKDIVKRLGFDADIDLLDTETEASYQLFHRAQYETETGLGQATEFSPAFDDSDLGSTNGEKARNTHFVVFVVVAEGLEFLFIESICFGSDSLHRIEYICCPVVDSIDVSCYPCRV